MARRKTGGRAAGTPNKRTQEWEALVAAAVGSGKTPLQYALDIMNDRNADEARRDDMCKASMNFVHPRKHSVEHGGKDGGPIEGKITIEFVSPPKRKGK